MVLIRNYQKRIKIDTKRLAEMVGPLAAGLGMGDRDLSLLFVSDRKIREMNRRFFDKDRPTNVISFSYLLGQPTEIAGEIILSAETALAEAEKAGIPVKERLIGLIVHGLLHIVGYDHLKGPAESRRMRNRERKLIASVLADPLYETLTVEPRGTAEPKA